MLVPIHRLQETLSLRKQMPAAKHVVCALLLFSSFPFAPPVNYNFEEQQPVIMDVQTHFSLNETWLTAELYWNNF